MCAFQVRQLEELLLHLTGLSHIQSSKEYVEAWELVLFTPFINGNIMVLAVLLATYNLEAQYSSKESCLMIYILS
jgi:hypothetical protein